MIAIARATASVAARQGEWIATLEPWRSLGYEAAGLSQFLRRAAAAGQVWLASRDDRKAAAVGVMVLQPAVLLGNFVALLAVRRQDAGRGIGRALVSRAEVETFAARRWLFVSADATNVGALAFYRKLRFHRVGRLPDLVRDGSTEILLRKGRPPRVEDVAAR